MAYKTKEWRNSMRVTVDYNYMMSNVLGERGITDGQLKGMKSKAEEAFEYVKANRGRDDLYMGWTELPYNQDAIVADILATAKQIRKKFKYFVVLGIGGSALGPIMAFNALCHLHYNELPPSKRRGPKFYVEDNVDPVRMAALLDVIEPEKTCFNVISKSGATSETMTQYLIISDILKQKGVNIADNMIFTTDAARGNLLKIDQTFGGSIKKYVLPDGVGGRFSELCPVGLLPAAVLGIDIKGLLAGAAYMDGLCSKPSVAKNPALACAALQYITMKDGKNINVLMPYSDNLKLMADWYCQLWAESLGKAVDYDGNVYVVAEHYAKGMDVFWHADKIKEKCRLLNWHTDSTGNYQALIDSAANQRTLASSKSVAELFCENGISVNTKVNKDVFSGINRVKGYLMPLDKKPRLFIFSNCTNMIREIKSYWWGENDMPKKIDDHSMDELRYYISSRPDAPKRKTEKTVIQKDKEKLMRKLRSVR